VKKLVLGIVDFRNKIKPGYKEMFAKLAIEQKPNALFVACSDSRVVPNLFASSDPGDLFVMRNVGNLIPPCDEQGRSLTDESEGAAVEFALLNLAVNDIVVCGHSECGAMIAISRGSTSIEPPHLKSWLRHGERALATGTLELNCDAALAPHNRLSQLNVLQQIEHLKTYPPVKKRLAEGRLRMHGWWFDIAKAEVYVYDRFEKRFRVIDESGAAMILRDLGEEAAASQIDPK